MFRVVQAIDSDACGIRANLLREKMMTTPSNRTGKPRFLLTSMLALSVATTSIAPVYAQEVPNPLQVLRADKTQMENFTVAERLSLLNFLRPADDQITCDDLDSADCRRAVRQGLRQQMRAGPSTTFTPEQVTAFGLLNEWRKANRNNDDAAEEDAKPVETNADAAADPKADKKAEKQAAREERKEKRKAAAAAATAEAETTADAADVEEEVVTEETSRSSSEDTAGNVQADNDRLLKAIGVVGAALAAGALLDNGDEVVEQTGDRLVVRRDGELLVRKDENELIRRPGSNVRTRTFDDGSTRTTVTKPNGNKVVTIRDADGYTIRRTRVLPDGREVVLFDDSAAEEETLNLSDLPQTRGETVEYSARDEAALRRALRQQQRLENGRTFTLRQIRENRRLRESVPQIDLDAINFETGSAAITPAEARDLAVLGNAIADLIEENPGEVFLIEGHTDAVGSEVSNLALSDRRAESVALALTEYFDVPPENMIVQGYGERFLKIETQDAARQNRRASVRRITPLLRSAQLR